MLDRLMAFIAFALLSSPALAEQCFIVYRGNAGFCVSSPIFLPSKEVCEADDASPAIQRALDELTTSGGTIHLPNCCMNINTALQLNVNHRPVTLEGSGWSSQAVEPFGGIDWTCTYVRGTVLRVAGQNDGVVLSAPRYNQNIVVKNLALLGPGSGTTSGINFGSDETSVAYSTFENILVANFANCFRINNGVSNTYINTNARGCGIGYNLVNNNADQNFYRMVAEASGTGFLINGGSGIRVNGGLIQSNGIGLHIAPNLAGSTALTFSDLWIENNSTNGILIDTTLMPIIGLSLLENRCAGSGGPAIATIGVDKALSIFKMSGMYCPGAAVTIPVNANKVFVDNANFASLVDNSSCATLINTPLPNKVGAC